VAIEQAYSKKQADLMVEVDKIYKKVEA